MTSPGAGPAPSPGHSDAAVTTRRTSLLASLALLAMTASWGSTFFLIRDLLERVPTLDFLAVRFLVAAASVLLVAPRAVARLSPESRRHAVMLGGVYGVAQVLQTAGLAHTPASVSGFITGMYVVLTPLLAAVLLRTRIGGLTWVASTFMNGEIKLGLIGLIPLLAAGACFVLIGRGQVGRAVGLFVALSIAFLACGFGWVTKQIEPYQIAGDLLETIDTTADRDIQVSAYRAFNMLVSVDNSKIPGVHSQNPPL